jgi:Cytochrome c554 and c-prime
MTPTHTRSLAATTGFASLMSALVLFSDPRGVAQEPKATASEPLSALHCIGCHSGPDSQAHRAYAAEGRTDFVRLDEYSTWHDRDLHAEAYEHITPKGGPDGTGNLAWTMQNTLKPHRPDGYSVHSAAECLTCHAVDRHPGPAASGKVEGRFHTTNGVSCEACHGLVSSEWIGQHIQTSWRDKAPGEKSKIGQVDLRDSYTRAMKCASCHVGNKAEGKFVTHEMYAAGHPPLPPFEVVTYSTDAPRHYFAQRDNKALSAMPAETAWKSFHFRKDECPEARAFAVGTVAGFEATMHLLADDAKVTKPSELLDFAHFDCYACHHDLKVPSWRQKRGYRGMPGRPTMRPWATETLQAVLKHAEAADGVDTEKLTRTAASLRTGLVALNKGYDMKPFGQPDEIAKQAAALAASCRTIRDELAPLVYDPSRTQTLYRLLVDRLTKADGKPGADGLYLDHDAAQQSVWGLRVLRDELRAVNRLGGTADPKAEAELDRITALHIRGARREPVAGERMRFRLDRIGTFSPDLFLPRAKAWLNEK